MMIDDLELDTEKKADVSEFVSSTIINEYGNLSSDIFFLIASIALGNGGDLSDIESSVSRLKLQVTL